MSDWNFYKAKINDSIASIYLNMEAKEDCAEERYSRLFWIFIRLKVERDDGLSHDDEFDTLCDYENIINANIKKSPIEFVGRITTQGMRQFYFYGSNDLNFDLLVESVVECSPSYQYQSGSKKDYLWSHYSNILFPEEQGIKQISERCKST